MQVLGNMTSETVERRYEQAGAFIRQKREASKLSLRDVAAQMAQLGVDTSASALQRLESGDGFRRHLADPGFIGGLAAVLRFSVAEILAIIWRIELPDHPTRERIREIIDSLEPDRLELAEQLLTALADQQVKRKPS